MWRKHRSVYQDHTEYIRNDIANPLKVKILCYTKRVIEMHELAKYLPPPRMKGKSTEASTWTACNQEFTVSEIRLVIKDGLPSSMRDELEDHQEDYSSLTYEYWLTSCPQSRLKTKGKGHQPISRRSPLLE